MDHNEQDLQRFMQIREEIHNELEKIPPLVLQLQEMTHRVHGYFKVFESLSQNAQDQLKATIKNASFEMAELAAEEFMQRIENQVHSVLADLEQSVTETRRVLKKMTKKNALKIIFIGAFLVSLSFAIGFILGGTYYEKKSQVLLQEFLKPLSIKEAYPKSKD